MMTRKWLGRIAGLTVALAAAPVHADQLEGWEVGPESGNTGCIAGRELPGGVLVSIRRATTGTEYYMVFSSANWDSLRPRAGQRIPIELLFATRDGDRRIRDEDAFIVATERGEEAVIGVWSGEEGASFRRIVNRARNVTLIGQGTEIGTYPLPRGPAVLAELDRCVGRLAPRPG
ncbi:MAG: hypothetical protein J0M19_03880 [Sphingomonadales bacterium]|nr:hypothetical protein [Sphingomonadales bacterium]